MNCHAHTNIKTLFLKSILSYFCWTVNFGNGAGNNVIKYPGVVLFIDMTLKLALLFNRNNSCLNLTSSKHLRV